MKKKTQTTSGIRRILADAAEIPLPCVCFLFVAARESLSISQNRQMLTMSVRDVMHVSAGMCRPH